MEFVHFNRNYTAINYFLQYFYLVCLLACYFDILFIALQVEEGYSVFLPYHSEAQ
jgi:hypothetical protein